MMINAEGDNGVQDIVALKNPVQRYITRLDPQVIERNPGAHLERARDMSIYEFYCAYRIEKGHYILEANPDHVVLVTRPHYKADENSDEYPLFCKYALIKYCPFSKMEDIPRDEEDCVEAWNEYLQRLRDQTAAAGPVPSLLRVIERDLSINKGVVNAAANASYEEVQQWLDAVAAQQADANAVPLEADDALQWIHITNMRPGNDDGSNLSDLVVPDRAFHQHVEHLGYAADNVIDPAVPPEKWLEAQKTLLGRDVDDGDVLEAVSPEALNAVQRIWYDVVIDHLRQPLHAPLWLIATGTAGTGKSHTIKAICKTLADEGGAVIRLAYTAKAARLIAGDTIHGQVCPANEQRQEAREAV